MKIHSQQVAVSERCKSVTFTRKKTNEAKLVQIMKKSSKNYTFFSLRTEIFFFEAKI